MPVKKLLQIRGNSFIMDGVPIRLLSGAIHYFRVVPEYWHDRLLKLKACGLNTVETYVPWNLHEPQPGKFCFEGIADIVRFIKAAEQLGLYVIVRPVPYICSEWDLGGLPSWLLTDPDMRLRCMNEPYLAAVDRFFDALFSRLKVLQSSSGGPIIAMQVENEYGSYGNDREYLNYLKNGMRKRGIDVLLFTSDGPTESMLQGGTLPDVLKAVNFDADPEKYFAKLREYQPEGPLMCGEFYPGWFYHWGDSPRTTDIPKLTAALDATLALGASVNFYMFHGGTNFGFMNGANHHPDTSYQPTITSYDFHAPLSEAGDPTPKYHALREIIGKYMTMTDLPVPVSSPKKKYGKVDMTRAISLFDVLPVLSKSVERVTPVPMEMLGQDYGFILYRTSVIGPRESSVLTIQDLHDRALVFVNKVYRGVLEREFPEKTLKLDFGPGEHQLDILVENMGRINFGPFMFDRKGITEGVRLGLQFLFHWKIFPLPMDNLSVLTFASAILRNGPLFYHGTFKVDQTMDTFLALPGWTKGFCVLNGVNLGRYWDRGPQRTFYVPAPLLKIGLNELIVFELHGLKEPVVEFRDTPDLG